MNRFEKLEAFGLVRFKVEPDECVSLEDLEGDMFNPDVNTDICPDQLATERTEFADRINRDGVYGIIGEYNIGHGWEHGDSVWGFVGNDFEDSGYDEDVRHETISALRNAIRSRCRHCMGTGQHRIRE